MDQSVVVDTDVDECAEVGDVDHDAWEFHSLPQVVGCLHVGVKLKGLHLAARVAARLFQFLHDVAQGGEAHGFRHVAVEVDLLAAVSVIYINVSV